MEVQYVCPHGCEAGYQTNDDGLPTCVECGTRTVDHDQSSLGRFVHNKE